MRVASWTLDDWARATYSDDVERIFQRSEKLLDNSVGQFRSLEVSEDDERLLKMYANSGRRALQSMVHLRNTVRRLLSKPGRIFTRN